METEPKKTRSKPRIWPLLVIAVLAISTVIATFFFGLTRTPKIYTPLPTPETGEVSIYFTNHIAPEFFNNVQLDKPFSLLIEQQGFNEIIADGTVFGWDWPTDLNGVTFTAPAAIFTKNRILLMGTVRWAAIPVVVTIVIDPTLDEHGMLTMNFQQITAGALNITPLAKYIATKIIKNQLETAKTDINDHWLKGLNHAFIENKPFDPVFPSYEEKHVRITKLKIENQNLTLTFEPLILKKTNEN